MGKPRLLSTVTMLLQFFAARPRQLLCMQRVACAFYFNIILYLCKVCRCVAATLDVASSSSGNNNNKAR